VNERPKKLPPLFKIVVSFPDGSQKVTILYGKPDAKLRYRSALQSAAKVGGWVSVFDGKGAAITL
jgi:hypothetical protein